MDAEGTEYNTLFGCTHRNLHINIVHFIEHSSGIIDELYSKSLT